MKWVSMALRGVKLSASSAAVKRTWIHTPTPPIRFHGVVKLRDNLILKGPWRKERKPQAVQIGGVLPVHCMKPYTSGVRSQLEEHTKLKCSIL
jgi:hypothetical protein